MAYKDINDKAIGFAKSGINERTGKIYLRTKDADEIQARVDKLRAELKQEEKALRSVNERIVGWNQEKHELNKLIDYLNIPRESYAFESLSDEEFEARRKQLRWEIADIVGHYTFIVDGKDPLLEIQGGF